jgi:penicillin-binding protein 2
MNRKRTQNQERGGYRIGARYLFFMGAVLVVFIYLISGIASLQIRSTEEHAQSAETNRTKKITLRGSRGMITDADAVILAKDEPIYNVTFYRDASQAYTTYTPVIYRTIGLIEAGGSQISVKFPIERDPKTNEWIFNFGTGVSESVLQTRESQWRGNHYLSAITYPTPEMCITKLIERYEIPETMDETTMLKIMAAFSEMQMNLFNSQPIVIAKDVPYATVVQIEANSMTLPGMEIAVSTKRVYPRGTLAAQVIGYLGPIYSDEKYKNELAPKGYKYSDIIGVDGVEASMEDWLTQNSDMRQGYRIVERDRVGKITRELSYTEPQDGNNVKLTIVASYQQQAERALAANLERTRAEQETKLMQNAWLEANKAEIEKRKWDKYPLSLADRAAMMVIDMEGRVLAMANYPTFDLNALTSGDDKTKASILGDPRNVLMNYNIHARGTPGSIFKMVAGLGALMEGKLLPTEVISDAGFYKRYNADENTAPKCWIPASQRYNHQMLDISGGISNSCNYFFYELGSRLSENQTLGDGKYLYEYASRFGLTSKTGVDLPGELRSVVGNQTSLYDPDKPMDESSQDTAQPILVFNSIKRHLRNQGAIRNIVYDDERLNRCVKALMDMAINTNQTDWVVTMRPILMEELDMTREMVNLAAIITDTYIYLNDIKWGGGQTVQLAIGQSITVLTPAAVSRYASALANGGRVNNLMLVDSVTNPQGDIISQRYPTQLNQFEGAEEYLPLILKGMQGVVDESGTASKYFRDNTWDPKKDGYGAHVAAKTGTAETTTIDLENNAWFIMLAPYSIDPATSEMLEKPEIAVVVFIPNGLSGGEASTAARDFVGWYLAQRGKRTESPLPGGNMLAP